MPWTYALLALSFVMILAGAFTFTNAVEWAGVRLGLGHAAVGSVLAAVATALPESTIPVIAILSGEQAGQIAIGAIVGAPFLLATLGMIVVGASAVLARGRREQGTRLRLHRASTVRDLAVFLVLLAVALLLGVLDVGKVVHVVAAVLFVLAYGVYVWRTVTRGGEAGQEEDPSGLFFDPSKNNPPRNVQIVLQVVVSLALIVGGAELFVTEVEHVAHALGVTALVLALALAPLASELPEKLNSVLWVRQGKDSLALGNITGAMVFQTAIPVAIGMVFVSWRLEPAALLAMACALVGGALALVNIWFVRRFTVPWLLGWLVLYGGVVTYLFTAA
ncbi:sodium:calcium antiporter [Actinophytocola gossypii]|uniref:Sodium:calcium antiporter n=1 Tax=Actinophytocola gossypii TaxID=2812003 RepID=A0ABT2J9J0_9PSEU|nr:hypothetical protein [Actinophytocola gossypii]MCT2583929.1 sodium:calcium antiporter [Actinophytocola gossypii]